MMNWMVKPGRATAVLLAILTIVTMLLSGCAPNLEKMIENEDVEGLIQAATYKLNTYSSELNASRDRARAALLEIGTPAIKPMIALLQAEDQSVVKFAIAYLGDTYDPRAAEALIEYRFFDSSHRQPARDSEAEEALYKIGSAAVVSMMGVLQTDRPEAVQFATNFLAVYESADVAGDLTAWLEMLEQSAYEEIALDKLSRSSEISIMEIMRGYMDHAIVRDGYFTQINVEYIQPVLEGVGIAAIPYSEGSPVPHPVVIADERPFKEFRADAHAIGNPKYDDPLNWNAYLPTSWRALGEPESIQLVLCWDSIKEEVIETANYSDGTTLKREVRLYKVTLREATTGKAVASKTLRGEDPDPLPDKKTFGSPSLYIGQLTPATLINWLRPYVEN
jgi:hypothetical protein